MPFRHGTSCTHPCIPNRDQQTPADNQCPAGVVPKGLCVPCDRDISARRTSLKVETRTQGPMSLTCSSCHLRPGRAGQTSGCNSQTSSTRRLSDLDTGHPGRVRDGHPVDSIGTRDTTRPMTRHTLPCPGRVPGPATFCDLARGGCPRPGSPSEDLPGSRDLDP